MQHKSVAIPTRHVPGAGQLQKSNLPVQPTPLIGREKVMAAVQQLLLRQDVRLLTLTGPGGIGKTRLGLQVAAELSELFPDGVYFVDLAPIRDPQFVVPTIAQTLALKETGERSLLDLLKAYLREKQLLLLLDNFEQVVSAAIQVADLLTACPQLKVVVTSRAALHVRGEQEFAVPPLAVPDCKQLPDLETLSQYEAVALFIWRARAVKPEFQLSDANASAIAEICVHLDGLPLAIELAAARIKLLPPQALLARLGQLFQLLTSGARDAPVRQQTLRNTIKWSYDLLSTREQRLFRRLAVFVGGCTLEAVEAICAAFGDETEPVVDTVASLIDKSLLYQAEQEGGEPRLAMLETIREYGVEALITNEEWEATLCAHAHYYLALAEQAEGELIGPQQVAWLGRLEQEHDNLRAVFNWALSPGSAEGGNKHRRALGLCLGGVLHEFWINHQHSDEGRALLERLITASIGVATAQRAKALNVAADLAYIQRDLQRAEELAQEALGLYRELGDRAGRAFSLNVLGNVASLIGEHTKAHTLLEEGMALYRELANKHRLGWSLYALGEAAFRRGDSAEAYAWYEEALMWFRELGNKPGIAGVLAHWAHTLVLYQGDSQTARALINEAIPLMRELGSTWWLALPFWLLGELALSQDDAVTAHSFAEEALVLDRESNRKSSIAMALSFLARVELHQGNDAAARSLFEESLTLSREIDDKDTLTFSLEGLAGLVAKQGEVIWAARLWGAAEALREAIHAPMYPIYRAGYERVAIAARTQLGEQAFALVWAEGRAMTLEQVLDVPPGHSPTPSNSRPVDTTEQGALVRSPEPAPLVSASLTPRESEVLRLLAQSLTSAQIAERLVIGVVTVNFHVRSIYSKLGVTSRSAATRYALEHHLV